MDGEKRSNVLAQHHGNGPRFYQHAGKNQHCYPKIVFCVQAVWPDVLCMGVTKV